MKKKHRAKKKKEAVRAWSASKPGRKTSPQGYFSTVCIRVVHQKSLLLIYQRLRQKTHLLHELEREVRLRVLRAQQNAPDVRVCRRVRLHRAKPYPSGHLSKTPPNPRAEKETPSQRGAITRSQSNACRSPTKRSGKWACMTTLFLCGWRM